MKQKKIKKTKIKFMQFLIKFSSIFLANVYLNIISNDYLAVSQLNSFCRVYILGDLIAMLGSIDFVLGSIDLINKVLNKKPKLKRGKFTIKIRTKTNTKKNIAKH